MPEAGDAGAKGIDKAAILLMSLGEEEASEILGGEPPPTSSQAPTRPRWE